MVKFSKKKKKLCSYIEEEGENVEMDNKHLIRSLLLLKGHFSNADTQLLSLPVCGYEGGIALKGGTVVAWADKECRQ